MAFYGTACNARAVLNRRFVEEINLRTQLRAKVPPNVFHFDFGFSFFVAGTVREILASDKAPMRNEHNFKVKWMFIRLQVVNVGLVPPSRYV